MAEAVEPQDPRMHEPTTEMQLESLQRLVEMRRQNAEHIKAKTALIQTAIDAETDMDVKDRLQTELFKLLEAANAMEV